MATYSRIKNWVSNEVLTASDLNAEFNNILTNSRPAGVEGASANATDMQATTDPGGVGSESLAGDLLGELKRLRFKIKQVIGGAQWYSTPANALSAITVLNTAISTTGTGSFTSSSTSFADVTNCTIAFTSTGRSVVGRLVWDTSQSSLGRITAESAAATTDFDVSYQVLRGATVVDTGVLEIKGASGSLMGSWPLGSINFEDPVAAGTYTYKLQVKVNTGTTIVGIYNAKLRVSEY